MRRARAVLAAWIALAAGAASAYPYCDPGKALERGRMNEQMYKALQEKRFDDLERHYGGLLQQYREGKISDAEVEYAMWPFRGTAVPGSSYDEWLAKHKGSDAARLAQAYHFVARGWAARGGKFSHETAQAQFRAMGEEFARADASLRELEEKWARPALVSGKRINVLMAVSASDKLEEVYQKAIARDPRSVSVRAFYIAASAPKWGGSARQIERAVEAARGLPEPDRRYIRALGDYEIAGAANLAKDDKRAAEYYEKVMAACPGLDDAAQEAIHLYTRMSQLGPLIAAATRYLERYPANGWGYGVRAWAYRNQGRHAEAFKDYERGARHGNARSFMMLGLYHEEGWPPATRDLQKALDYYLTAYEKGDAEAKAKVDSTRRKLGVK